MPQPSEPSAQPYSTVATSRIAPSAAGAAQAGRERAGVSGGPPGTGAADRVRLDSFMEGVQLSSEIVVAGLGPAALLRKTAGRSTAKRTTVTATDARASTAVSAAGEALGSASLNHSTVPEVTR